MDDGLLGGRKVVPNRESIGSKEAMVKRSETGGSCNKTCKTTCKLCVLCMGAD